MLDETGVLTEGLATVLTLVQVLAVVAAMVVDHGGAVDERPAASHVGLLVFIGI